MGDIGCRRRVVRQSHTPGDALFGFLREVIEKSAGRQHICDALTADHGWRLSEAEQVEQAGQSWVSSAGAGWNWLGEAGRGGAG